VRQDCDRFRFSGSWEREREVASVVMCAVPILPFLCIIIMRFLPTNERLIIGLASLYSQLIFSHPPLLLLCFYFFTRHILFYVLLRRGYHLRIRRSHNIAIISRRFEFLHIRSLNRLEMLDVPTWSFGLFVPPF